MDTPLEYLEKRLSILKLVTSGRGFSQNKRDAKRLIPVFSEAIELLKANEQQNEDEADLGISDVMGM